MIAIFRAVLLLGLFCVAFGVQARPLERSEVPQALEPWVDWVLQRNPEAACPVNYDNDERRCVWPGTLSLSLDRTGATFTQKLTVLSESRFALPGGARHWPFQVRVDSQPVSVINDSGRPTIVLTAGEHRIDGRFSWRLMPNSIELGAGTGIVRLTIDGQEVLQPDRRNGRLWLRSTVDQKNTATPEDSVSLRVFRRVVDGHPLRVETELALQVSGKPREIKFEQVLLDGATALQLSSRLPARLEPDGSLRVQIRPGNWKIRVSERHTGMVASLQRPAQSTQWPSTEYWSWQAAPEIRGAEISGPDLIDPRQVTLPEDWQGLPTYKMPAGQSFNIKTVRRGDPTPEPDQLSLNRELWLAFDGETFAVRDNLNGRLTSTWRLNAQDSLQLGQVLLNGQPQFITRTEDGDTAGVEVRRGRLRLIADSRIDKSRPGGSGPFVANVPAAGWQHDFNSIKTALHTPPGWRVLAATGVDSAPGSWLEAWSLYDLFLVLIIAVAAGRLWGWPWVLVSGIMLALIWHEPDAPRLSWLVALVPIALLRVVSTSGMLSRALHVFRAATLIVLCLISIVFVVEQARSALHPQLESTSNPQAALAPHAPAAAPREEALAEMESADQIAPSAQSASVSKARKYAANRIKESRKALEAAVVSSRNPLVSVDPKAIVQTGPGMPDWHWRTTRLLFSGPVLAEQNISLVLLSPSWRKLWQLSFIVLIGLMVWRLIGWRPGNTAGTAGWRWQHALLLIALMHGSFNPVDAAQFPPDSMLKELERRLLEQPAAAPRASLPEMSVDISPEQLRLMIEVETLQRTAVPLPADMQRMMPARIRLNGVLADERTLSDDKGVLWMLVPEGQHLISIEFQLPRLNQFELALPLAPARVRVAQTGWRVSGLDRNGVPGNQLTMTRDRPSTEAKPETLQPTDLPPLLSIVRTLRLGLTWEVETRAIRISPRGAPISINVPLLDGENVITENISVRDGHVQARFAAGTRQVSWRSRIAPVPEFKLTAADNPAWTETWRLEASPIWRVQTTGISPVFHQDSQTNWLPTWKPWAGESVGLSVSRPAGIDGQSKTIDKVRMQVNPGSRAVDTTLKFTLRSSRGDQHTVTLPEGALLQQVRINNKTRAIRPENRQVVLPVVPGSQEIQLQWRSEGGVDSHWQGPIVDMGQQVINTRIAVTFPKDRWVLWTAGPTLGPAVLIWGVLGVMLAISIALGRIGNLNGRAAVLPLGMFSWFLLAVGLTQVTVLAMVIVVGWFLVLQARGAIGDRLSRWSFNAMQIGIALLTLISLAVLFAAVQAGLLGHPDMQISGYGSSATRFNWYADQSGAILPQVELFSAPLWQYRILMLLWALWLAWSLLNWLRWGWNQFSAGGLWRPFVRTAKPVGPDRPDDPNGSAGPAIPNGPTDPDGPTDPNRPPDPASGGSDGPQPGSAGETATPSGEPPQNEPSAPDAEPAARPGSPASSPAQTGNIAPASGADLAELAAQALRKPRD